MALEGGSSGGANQIRAGKAVVEIGGDNSPLIAALDQAKGLLTGFGAKVQSIGVNLSAFGAGLLAPLVAALKKEIDFVTEAGKLSTVLGEPVEKVSALGYAFKKAGLEVSALADLQQKISGAADNPQGSIFWRMGLNARQLLNLPIEQQLATIATAWNKIPVAADRARVAQELFGDQGVKALTMLAKGPEALAEAMRQAAAAGAIVTAEQVGQAKLGKQALRELAVAGELAFLSLGGAILEPAAEMMQVYGKAVATVAGEIRAWIGEHKEAVQIVAGVGVGLLATGVALTVAGKAISIIGGGFGQVFSILAGGAAMVKTLVVGSFLLAISAAKVLVLSILGLASPLVAIVGLATALGVLWISNTEGGQQFGQSVGSVLGNIRDGFAQMVEDGKQAWSGIVAAVKQGDFELAASIAFKFIGLEWARLTNFMTRGWIQFKDLFLDTLIEMQEGLARQLVSPIGAHFFSALAGIEEVLGLDESAALDRNAAEQILKNREGVQKQLTQMEREGAEARKKARKSEMDAALADVQRAQDELKGLVERAKGGPPGKAELLPMPRDVNAKELAKQAAAMRGFVADSTKGGFGNITNQQFGVGDTVGLRSLLAENQKQNVNLLKIEKAIENINVARFK